MDKALIIFVKNLVMGKVKTRLARKIGSEKAFNIYQYLLEHTSHTVEQVNCDKYVFYSDFIEAYDPLFNTGYQKRLQRGEGLGERMSHAFKQLFETGYQKVAVIGSDNPEITSLLIDDAFEQLTCSDIVIGPSQDGGYYLIATNKFYPVLFEHIPWSTPAVLRATISICRHQNIRYQLLQVLSDIDTEDNWNDFIRSSGGKNI